MDLLIINGPNMNMLGLREPEVYGNQTFKDLEKYIKDVCAEEGINCTLFQSNNEGDIVTTIQRAYGLYDGIIINPAAYTHYSISILDALKAINIPYIEVHLTDIFAREEYRKVSITGQNSVKIIVGLGFESYKVAIKDMKEYLLKEK